MDKTTSDTAPQTSDVKEEMGLKWIKQPATFSSNIRREGRDGAQMDKTTSDIAPQISDVNEEMGLKWIKQAVTLSRKHPM